jgi:hypothetical protein
MATKFTDFLVSFGDDPQQLLDFEKNPQAVMTKAGLTPAEQNMILNRNVQAIRAHLHADPGLRQAMGIPAAQPLPNKLPMCIYLPVPGKPSHIPLPPKSNPPIIPPPEPKPPTK